MTTKSETPEERKNRETVESIANNIGNLCDAVGSLLKGPLKKRALVVLLAHSSELPMNKVEAILKALENLKADWLN